MKDEYRTQDGNAHFSFNFVLVNGKVEIDIIKMPRRLHSFTVTDMDMIPSERGGYKINNSATDLVTNMEQAKQIASRWAENVWNKINSSRHETSIMPSNVKPHNTGKHIVEMQIFQNVYDEMCGTVGSEKPETGGILLGSRDDYIVQKFVFDPHGSRSPGGYDPDVNYLNKIIKKEWKNNQLELIGFLHSHPRGVSRLSGDWGNNTGDIGYIKAIFDAIPDPKFSHFLVPIMFSTYDGGPFEILPFIASRENPANYRMASKLINEHGNELIDQPQTLVKKFISKFSKQRTTKSKSVTQSSMNKNFLENKQSTSQESEMDNTPIITDKHISNTSERGCQ